MSIQDKIQDWCKKLNRKAQYTITFFSNGKDFHAFEQATIRAHDTNFRQGPICEDDPIALAKGLKLDLDENTVSFINDWRNIPEEQYYRIDGLILSEDFRDGDVAIVVFE